MELLDAFRQQLLPWQDEIYLRHARTSARVPSMRTCDWSKWKPLKFARCSTWIIDNTIWSNLNMHLQSIVSLRGIVSTCFNPKLCCLTLISLCWYKMVQRCAKCKCVLRSSDHYVNNTSGETTSVWFDRRRRIPHPLGGLEGANWSANVREILKCPATPQSISKSSTARNPKFRHSMFAKFTKCEKVCRFEKTFWGFLTLHLWSWPGFLLWLQGRPGSHNQEVLRFIGWS